MNCRGCGGDAIGLLEGEPVCGACAQSYSFASKHHPEVRLRPGYTERIVGPILRLHTLFVEKHETPGREYASGGNYYVVPPADLLDVLRRRNDDALFYARAREAAANGGCRV